MSEPPARWNDHDRAAIVVRGVIQGVGFRPFVYRAARASGLSGWVANETDRVRIEVQGPRADVERFLHVLRHEAPPQARIDAIEVAAVACVDEPDGQFCIRSSASGESRRPSTPADLATCDECLAEIRDPAQRRFAYPFTNCTRCGPRWSIITSLPYDRPRTSMSAFGMCPACRAEYEAPSDRRFHAQPIACPRCGPAVELLDRTGRVLARGPEALAVAVAAIQEGRIVALKGLGGFQLLVDALQSDSVVELRRRKHRPDKPFAVMATDLDEARRYCDVSEEEGRWLASHQAPILLLRRKPESAIAGSVAPGNPYLGVMLPYTPLHHVLLGRLRRPVVCTSGNLSEEPMAIETADAMERLGPIADVLLVHDRPIVRPVDDSVARCTSDGLQVLRRARGFAPLAIELGADGPPVLAVGGHLKNTVALALGSQAILTPHVGDLDSVLSVEVHERAIDDLVRFFDVVPQAVACDMHPDYASTRVAQRLAAQWGVPLVRVQHHHAHVAACMAEHQVGEPVLGLAWDGTGYGPDGTVWGGEFLVCQADGYRRVARLRTFPLPGGERAVREPRRSALGLLYEMDPSEGARHAADWFERSEQHTILQALQRGLNAPRTSSLGRLFDAVAALCGLSAVTSFEGQAAMALEFAAEADCTEAYPFPLLGQGDEPAVADWEPLLRGVLDDREAGVPIRRTSARFHNALAELALGVARRVGLRRVALSGGCFQNALLHQRVRRRLLDEGYDVLTHREVPPGDGGIALGQLWIARNRLQR